MAGPGVRPPPYAAHPHAVDQPFHHLQRTPRWRWWRPLVGLGLLALLWLVANLLLFGLASVGTSVTGIEAAAFTADESGNTGPLALLLGNLGLAVLIPAAALAVLVAHRERPGWLSSVAGRLRWALLWRFTLLAAATTVIGYGTLLVVPDVPGEPAQVLQTPDPGLLIALLAVMVVSTPLQAAAEEYAFRGYLLQAVAGWIPWSRVALWVAGALSATLFALAHGTQDPGLFASRLFFGLVATWTVARTGGLEAAIALHTVNNLIVGAAAISAGALSETLGETELAWRYASVDIVATAAFGVLVVLWSRRLRPQRRSVVATPYAGLHPGAGTVIL